jgi:uncharacterized membrane-anchored protein YhcB (DUF1043 family)
MNKDLMNRIIGVVLVGVIILLLFKNCQIQKGADHDINELKKSIIASDKLTKEADGRYAKLVDYYASQGDLMKELKDSNKDLYKTIKKQDERLLSITSSIITLDQKIVQGFAEPDPVDTNRLNLSLKYPDEKDPFVYWDGWVNKNTAAYKGTFSFGKLPIQIILTEDTRGLWKSRIVGPEWLKVDSLSIKSLPPAEYASVKPKTIQWLIGGNYIQSLNNTGQGVGINFGLNVFDKHNLIIGANTLNQVSLGYMYKIKTFKRNK